MADPAPFVQILNPNDQRELELARARARQAQARALDWGNQTPEQAEAGRRIAERADQAAAQKILDARMPDNPSREAQAGFPGAFAQGAGNALGAAGDFYNFSREMLSPDDLQLRRNTQNFRELLALREKEYQQTRTALSLQKTGDYPGRDYGAFTGEVLNPYLGVLRNPLALPKATPGAIRAVHAPINVPLQGAKFGLAQAVMTPTDPDYYGGNKAIQAVVGAGGGAALGGLTRLPPAMGFGADRAVTRAKTAAELIAERLRIHARRDPRALDVEPLAQSLDTWNDELARFTREAENPVRPLAGDDIGAGENLQAATMNARDDIVRKRGLDYAKARAVLTNDAGTGLVDRAERLQGYAVGDTQEARDFVQKHRDLLTPDLARTPEVTPTSAAPLTAISTRIVRAFDTNTVELTAAEAAEATANGFRVASRPGPDVTVYRRVGKYPGDPLEEITADQARGLGSAQVQISTYPGDPIYSRTFKNSYEALEQLARQFGDQFDVEAHGAGATGVIAGRDAAEEMNKLLDKYVLSLGGNRRDMQDVWREGAKKLKLFDTPLGQAVTGTGVSTSARVGGSIDAVGAMIGSGPRGVRELLRAETPPEAVLDAVRHAIDAAIAPVKGVPRDAATVRDILGNTNLGSILRELPDLFGAPGAALQRDLNAHIAGLDLAAGAADRVTSTGVRIAGTRADLTAAQTAKDKADAASGKINLWWQDLQRGLSPEETLKAATALVENARTEGVATHLTEDAVAKIFRATRLTQNSGALGNALTRFVRRAATPAAILGGTYTLANPGKAR